MDVSFVDHDDGILRLVGNQVLDIGMAGQRAGGIVWAAYIKDPSIGRGGNHGANIVGVILGKRHLEDARIRRPGCKHSGFVTGICGHIAALRRSEGSDGVMQRLARSGIEANVFGLKAFELRQLVDQVFGQPVGVAATLSSDGNDGLAGGGTGAEGILVGVDHHAFMDQVAGGVGQHGLGDDAQRERGGCGGRHSQKRSARCGKNWTFRHESPLAGYLTAECARRRAIWRR